MKVASFDVFDTVLTRRVGDPEALIDVLAERLHERKQIPGSAASFAAARRTQERELNRRLGRHATLTEIHTAVARALNEPEDVAAQWVEAEQELERELSVALPGAAERLADAWLTHDRVVFVSDTPHSEQFVHELLQRAGLARDTDTVVTSAGRPHSKSSGGLFGEVAAGFPAGAEFHHVGDNRRSDVAGARLEGWASTHAPEGKLNRYEHLLETHAGATEQLTSWLAGASRLARLESKDVAGPVAAVSAGAFAPMLVGYALWVVAQARRRGIRRLYFVARDGQVMLEAARHVAAQVAPDLELRYLYGSRKPWIFGAAATDDVALERWVTPRKDYTPRTAFARVDLTPAQVHELTGHPLADPARADVALSAEERAEVVALLTTEPLVSLVREAAERTAQVTLSYLRQEMLLDGTPGALVDAGWEGRTAAAFDHLVRRGGGGQHDHFVIGMLPSAADPRAEQGVRMTPWLFDLQREPRSWPGFTAPNLLVEMLCAGTHGRTLGYREVDGRVEPVLGTDDNELPLAWGLAEMQGVAVRAAELAAPYLSERHLHVDTRGAVADVLRAFWTRPTRAEAEAWGSFPWEEEIWPPYVPVAQRLTTTEVVQRLRRGDRSIRRVNSWRAGSAAVSGQPWKAMLRARAWQEENRERLGRLPRRVRLEVARRRR